MSDGIDLKAQNKNKKIKAYRVIAVIAVALALISTAIAFLEKNMITQMERSQSTTQEKIMKELEAVRKELKEK